jgi:hypothetical protein
VGNFSDLATELCLKRLSPCLFPSLSTSFAPIENAMNQLIFSDLLMVALGCRFAAQNYSLLNRIALNLLKNDKTIKVGVRGKRLKAGWNNNYLIKLIRN